MRIPGGASAFGCLFTVDLTDRTRAFLTQSGQSRPTQILCDAVSCRTWFCRITLIPFICFECPREAMTPLDERRGPSHHWRLQARQDWPMALFVSLLFRSGREWNPRRMR